MVATVRAAYPTVLQSPMGEDVISNLGSGVAVDGAVSSDGAPDTRVWWPAWTGISGRLCPEL